MADVSGEAPVEAPPEDVPAEEDAAPDESADAAPVDKLAKWKKATRLQVNAMRATGTKEGVPGGLAFGAEEALDAEGENAAADAPAAAQETKDAKALWGKAGKFVKTATAFGSKPETAEAVPDDFRVPASVEVDAAKAAAEASALEAPETVAPTAASRWAKAKAGVSMVRALSGDKGTEYGAEEPVHEGEAIDDQVDAQSDKETSGWAKEKANSRWGKLKQGVVNGEAMINAAEEEDQTLVGGEEVPPSPEPARPPAPAPLPHAIPMAEVNARVAALEDLAKYSLGLNPEPPLGNAGGSRQRENLLM